MLNFIIYEDKNEDIELICKTINKLPLLKDVDYRIHRFNEYSEKLEQFIKNKEGRNIYILDIEVGEVSGLEIGSMIREKDWQSIIIFITNHRKYKDDVIFSRLMPLDFIQKQHFCEERLAGTIKIALNALVDNKFITFTSYHIAYHIALADILPIEKLQMTKKCIITLESGLKIEVNKPLHEISKMLDQRFYQTHKSCIVNVRKILKLSFTENKITFANGTEIYLLASRRKKGLKEHVKQFK